MMEWVCVGLVCSASFVALRAIARGGDVFWWCGGAACFGLATMSAFGMG